MMSMGHLHCMCVFVFVCVCVRAHFLVSQFLRDLKTLSRKTRVA